MPVFYVLSAPMRLPGRVAFSALGVDVYWFGVLLALGAVAMILLAQSEVRRLRLGADTAVDMCLLGIPLGVVFARLFYVLAHFSYFKVGTANILHIWDGGLSVYGAIIGALLALALYSRIKRIPFLRLADVVAPGLALAQGISCWGDFFNQRGYGPEVTSRALEWFPLAVLIEDSDTIHCAVFFYEFLWCALLFAALWFIVRKRAARAGTVALWYALVYSFGHAAFSMLRVDSVPVLWGLSSSALFSLALFLLSLALLLAHRVRARRAERSAPCAEPSGATFTPYAEPEEGDGVPGDGEPGVASGDAPAVNADGAEPPA